MGFRVGKLDVGKLEGLDSPEATKERFAQIRSIRQIRSPDHIPGNLLGSLGGPFGGQTFRFAADKPPFLNDQGYESSESY
jgi:hypothetical protein